MGVVDQQGVVIEEDSLGFLERNTMPFPVCPVLSIVPFEPEIGHADSVATL
jgi:hypothetical protein